MSCREKDPLMRLADLVLENRAHWWYELYHMEPKAGSSYVRITFGRAATASSPVEAFEIRKENLAAVLNAVRRRVRRMKPLLRRVEALKWGSGMTHSDIAKNLRIGIRSVDRYVGQIRACVAGTLRRLGPKKLADFWRNIGGSEAS